MLHELHGGISVQRAVGRKGDARRYTDFNRSLPPAEASRPSSQVRRPPLSTHSMPASPAAALAIQHPTYLAGLPTSGDQAIEHTQYTRWCSLDAGVSRGLQRGDSTT